MSSVDGDDGLRPPPPPPPRVHGALRRRSRWLLPVIGLCVAPLPVIAGVAVLAGLGWMAVRVVRADRARRVGSRDGILRAGQIELGRDERGRPVCLDDRQLGAHGLILGASGSGKSTTLIGITSQQILQGRPVVVIDLKGSQDLADQLRRASAAAGRPFRVWSPDGATQWNPLARGNPTELKDKLISTERFTEPHYQRAAERYVQTALQVMAEADSGRPAGLGRVVELLDPARLRAAAQDLPTARRAHIEEYVRTLSPDQLSAVRGLQSRLAVISESHTGRFLESEPGAIDLRRALDGHEVVLFSLNASSYGALSAQLGALAVQDLVSAAGARERSGRPPVPATVAIDEFSGLAGDHVLALIARGRSAGVSVLLATQELADLDRAGRGFRQQVLGSTAVKIAHRQDVTESAHDIARLAGTEPVWEASYSSEDGAGRGRGASTRVSHRLVDRPRVAPTVVQSLATGEAVVISKVPTATTRLTRIRPLALGRADDRSSGRTGAERQR